MLGCGSTLVLTVFLGGGGNGDGVAHNTARHSDAHRAFATDGIIARHIQRYGTITGGGDGHILAVAGVGDHGRCGQFPRRLGDCEGTVIGVDGDDVGAALSEIDGVIVIQVNVTRSIIALHPPVATAVGTEDISGVPRIAVTQQAGKQDIVAGACRERGCIDAIVVAHLGTIAEVPTITTKVAHNVHVCNIVHDSDTNQCC